MDAEACWAVALRMKWKTAEKLCGKVQQNEQTEQQQQQQAIEIAAVAEKSDWNK